MFKGIPWKQINKEYKNDYDKASDAVLSKMTDIDVIRQSAEDILRQCESLDLKYKRNMKKAK